MVLPEEYVKYQKELMKLCEKIQSKSESKYENSKSIEKKVYYVLNRIYYFGISLHEAILSLCNSGWVHVAPIIMRSLLECIANFLAIINSKEPEYMAFKFLYQSHIRIFRDSNFPLGNRKKANQKIESGIQDLSRQELREKAKEYAYKHPLTTFFFQPEIKDIKKLINSYGGAILKLKYVYGILSQIPHGQYHGLLFYKEDLNKMEYKPSYNKRNIEEVILFSDILLYSLLKLRNDFEILGFATELEKLEKIFHKTLK